MSLRSFLPDSKEDKEFMSENVELALKFLESKKSSEDFLQESGLLEIFQKYIPFKIVKEKSTEFTAQFTIPAEDLDSPAPTQDGSLTYTVHFSGGGKGSFIINRDGVQENITGVPKAWYLTFNNDVSGYSPSGRGQASLVFSTVSRVFLEFVKRMNPNVVSFSAAHEGLVPVYKILAKRAESFGLVWSNKDRIGTFYLVDEKLYEKAYQAVLRSRGNA